jgi:CheY-like chemotaxis protein
LAAPLAGKAGSAVSFGRFFAEAADVERLARAGKSTLSAAARLVSTTRVPAASASLVLIADANARTLAARAEQLLAAGLRVSKAHSSFEAIVKATCHLPDLILLDGSLGGLDATETGRLLTTCPVTAHIPIFKLTPGRRVPRRVLAAALRQPA